MDMDMDKPSPHSHTTHSMQGSMPGMSTTFSTTTHVTLFFTTWTTKTPATYILTLLFLFSLGLFNRFLSALRTQLERPRAQDSLSENENETAHHTHPEKTLPTTTATVKAHVRQWSRALQLQKQQPANIRLDDPEGERETAPLSPGSEAVRVMKEVGLQGEKKKRRFWVADGSRSFGKDAVFGVIEFSRAFIGYILMLAVMTYNVGFLFAVTGSVLVGEILFGRYTQVATGWQEGGCH